MPPRVPGGAVFSGASGRSSRRNILPLAAMPFSPEITIKIGLKPALVIKKAELDEEISIEELK